jgi:hypothetical protein
MKRECPQILESATTPHDVIFIPEVSQDGNLAKKVLKIFRTLICCDIQFNYLKKVIVFVI